MSEQGRLGVSGPEVIETNKGVEEFDAGDKALVWSTDGGKNRRLIGGADAFSEDSMEGFRAATKDVSRRFRRSISRRCRQSRSGWRSAKSGLARCDDAVSMWRTLGIVAPEAIRDMGSKDFAALANSIKDANHDAR